MRTLISTGSPFEATAGYSRAVIDGEWVFVSGTTGYDYANMVMPEDPVEQTRNCFKTISETLVKAGASLAEVVRVHYYVTDRAIAEKVFPVFGEYFGDIRPAATLLVCDLLDPAMKIEIEVTALKRKD